MSTSKFVIKATILILVSAVLIGLGLHTPTVKPKVTVDVQGLEPRDIFAVIYMGSESQKHSLTKADAEAAYDFSNSVMEIRKRK